MNIDDIENPSLWIENWCLGGHFKPLSIFGSNLNHFSKNGFFPIFLDFRIFYAIFLYCSEGPKWANMFFFKWNLEWPPDVQIMYTKLSQGQFICVLSISKLRMTISHEELAKIDIYGQNTSNPLGCPVSHIWTWLLATYMTEKAKLEPRNRTFPVKARFQQPEVVKGRLTVRLKALMFLSQIPISLKWFT